MQPDVELDSRDFPQQSRALAFRDAAAVMCLLDITPNPDVEFTSVLKSYQLSDLIINKLTWSAATTVRTSEQAYATGDNVIIHIPLSGQFSIQQAGGAREICRPGDVYIDPTATTGVDVFDAPRTDLLYLSLPREQLTQLLGSSVEENFRRKLPLTAPWQLLIAYAGALTSNTSQLSSDEQLRCASHLKDLLVMALARREKIVTQGSAPGLRAARLSGIKQQIHDNLSNPALSAEFLAAHCGISARYIRSLFADEYTTISQYIQEQRLERVYQVLVSSNNLRLRISELAYNHGFGDLSWFNHVFKKRYGLTPKDVRAMTLSG